MKNKGFTLVELLGVLVVLAIMLIVTVPAITSSLKSADQKEYDSFVNNIIDSAELYVETNREKFPELSSIGGVSAVPIRDLIDSGFLKENTINPDTDEVVDRTELVGLYVNDDKTIYYEYPTQLQTVGSIAQTLLDSHEIYTYMGGTYLKGAVDNNYAWYNGFIWRIMGVNSDGSVRLITEEDVSSITWGTDTGAQDYNGSYIKDWVNNYFLTRLKSREDIVETSFCEDSTLVTSSSSARTTCTTPVTAMAGILSIDEYNLSGGSSSYLVNGQFYWTLTPNTNADVWTIYNTGGVNSGKVRYLSGIRVVISVSPDMIITAGNGTLTGNSDTEYVLNQSLNVETETLKESAGSGEYVKFDGRTYRIMEHTDTGTKLILDGFYDTTVAYGNDFQTMSTLLTSTSFKNWLVPTRQTDLINTTWYRGANFTSGSNYKDNLSSTENPFTNTVALVRVGEMLANQSLSLISKNYTTANTSANSWNYWAMTPCNTTTAWNIRNYGVADLIDFTATYGVRPVIMVSSDLVINAGNGTLSAPYEI